MSRTTIIARPRRKTTSHITTHVWSWTPEGAEEPILITPKPNESPRSILSEKYGVDINDIHLEMVGPLPMK